MKKNFPPFVQEDRPLDLPAQFGSFVEMADFIDEKNPDIDPNESVQFINKTPGTPLPDVTFKVADLRLRAYAELQKLRFSEDELELILRSVQHYQPNSAVNTHSIEKKLQMMLADLRP